MAACCNDANETAKWWTHMQANERHVAEIRPPLLRHQILCCGKFAIVCCSIPNYVVLHRKLSQKKLDLLGKRFFSHHRANLLKPHLARS